MTTVIKSITTDYSELNDFLNQKHFSDIIVLCDSNSKALCLPLFQKKINPQIRFNIISFENGEQNKNMNTVEFLLSELLKLNIDRHALIINLGGGIVSDIGGFIASIFKRGIQYINLPTTLLAMCDASIGGKTGVNFKSIKNQIGSFHLPEVVFIDVNFLKTLPKCEIDSGLGEMIKTLILEKKWLTIEKFRAIQTGEFDEMLILQTIQIKNAIVEADYKETKERLFLNLGHTIGHGIESFLLAQNCEVPHGICVLYGIGMEDIIFGSQNLHTYLKPFLVEFQNYFSIKIDWKAVKEFILHDKKSNNKHFNIPLFKNKLTIDTVQLQEYFTEILEQTWNQLF